MATLSELSTDALSDVAEVPATAVRVLWVDDFYDGPLSGIVEWGGRRFRFEMTDRSTLGQEDGPRRYWLIALSPEQINEEERWQDLFCTHVWTGFDYRSRPQNRASASEHSKFYAAYAARAVPDYSGNEVVGWFQLGAE